jgi:hypothetical protein
MELKRLARNTAEKHHGKMFAQRKWERLLLQNAPLQKRTESQLHMRETCPLTFSMQLQSRIILQKCVQRLVSRLMISLNAAATQLNTLGRQPLVYLLYRLQLDKSTVVLTLETCRILCTLIDASIRLTMELRLIETPVILTIIRMRL